MTRACRFLALVVLPWVLAACVVVGSGGRSGTGPAPQEAPGTGADASVEDRIARDVFERVNDERAERDLQPLEWNDALAEIASEWSVEMAAEGRLEHQDIGELMGSDERLSGFAGVGENIFTASAPVPAGTMHAGWMRSDGHRANVLNPGWNRFGIGVHCADDGSTWATQQFGRTVDADRPSVARTTPPREPIVRSEEDGPSCG